MAKNLQAKPRDRVTPHNDGRAALIEAAIAKMSKDGPALVQPNELCIELGLAKSLVNFHFGGRDGLIAEALAISYERYVVELAKACDTAGPEAIDRLRTWTDQQLDWTIENPGIACGLTFFKQGSSLHRAISLELQTRIASNGDLAMDNLRQLVTAALCERFNTDVSGDSVVIANTAFAIDCLVRGASTSLGARDLPSNQPVQSRSQIEQGRNLVWGAVISLLERSADV
jgi:AcrR family transcriptional regulator